MATRDPLRVGFVGAGRISSLHRLHYQDAADASLVAICDTNEKLARAKADEWGIPRDMVFHDLDAMLRRDEIDAVEILTPHSQHAAQAVLACEAGKHVSVQKVPCMSLSEFDAMQAAARRAGVVLKVYENFQFHPPYRRALEIIESGAIGKAMAVNIRMWSSVKPLGAWDVPISAWKWRISEKDNFKLPNLFDDGYHKHNIVHLFLGKDIHAVSAWNAGFRIYKLVKIDVPAVVSYKTRGVEYGTWNVSIGHELPVRSDFYGCDEAVEIQCERGIIWVNGCTGNMFHGCECGGPGTPGVYWMDARGEWHADCSMATNWKHSFMACTADFIEAIREGRPPYRSGKEARHVLAVDLAIVASLRAGFKDVRVASITDGLPRGLEQAGEDGDDAGDDDLDGPASA